MADQSQLQPERAMPVIDPRIFPGLRHDFVDDPDFVSRNFEDLNNADHILADEANIIAVKRSGGSIERHAGFIEGVQFAAEALRRHITSPQLEQQIFEGSVPEISDGGDDFA